MSLDLGRLLKFRPSKTENLEEAEGKSPSLFVDFQVRVLSTLDLNQTESQTKIRLITSTSRLILTGLLCRGLFVVSIARLGLLALDCLTKSNKLY